MAQTEFQRSLEQVLKEEGGYSNNPKDPGGATQKGITQKVYDTYLEAKGESHKPVKNIPQDEVEEIYRTRYWALAKCDSLPVGVGYVVFDGAVNSGVSQSAKWLQRALGITVDGVIGPATIAAAKAYTNHSLLVDKICDARLAFLKALKTWPTFGKGWAARVSRVRANGKAWATGVVAPAQRSVRDDGGAKAVVADAKAAPAPAAGDAATGAGGAGITLSGILYAAKDQLTPFQGSSAAIDKMIAGIVIVSLLVSVGGIAWRIYAARKKVEHKEALGVPNV